MIIVRALPVLVEHLARDRSVLPSVEELRPSSCPSCGQPSRPPGERLGIVGHGTYERQILGLAPGGQVTIPVRRFNCRGCPHTISVLPDELHPGRLYSAAAILLSLVMALAEGHPARATRERFGSLGETEGWKTVRRWRRDLLVRLWGWLGSVSAGCCLDRHVGRHRLQRLLGCVGLTLLCTEDQLTVAARELTRTWPPGHDRDDDFRRTRPG